MYKNAVMQSYRKQPSYVHLVSALISVLLLCAATAAADIREDAEAALTSLNQTTATMKFPHEMNSLNLVITAAREYYAQESLENGDRFYLLALQKARVIELILKAAETAPATETVSVPGTTETPPSPESSLPVEPSEPAEPAAPFLEEPDSSRLVGAKGIYTVVKDDNLRLVAAKLGVTQQHLRSLNGLSTGAHLKIGQKLVYNNRKIIPQKVKNGIVINIPDRTLYYFQQGVLVTSLPVALGSATKNEKYVWQTPVGKFRITAKMKDPTWTVPPSIQTEMEEQGKEVISSIPPGPENPLGKYAFKTSIPGILIHSTIRPSSIYSFSSHGCIRISPNRMEEFFPLIKVDTRGEIIYQPVKLTVAGNGRVFLEVHRDVYGKSAGLVAEARQLIEKQKLTDQIDWEKFQAVVKQKNGVAEDISL